MTVNEGTEIWGSYADQFYKNSAAVTHRKLGRGTVTYIGVDTDDGNWKSSHATYLPGSKCRYRRLADRCFIGMEGRFPYCFELYFRYSDYKHSGIRKIMIGSACLEPAGVAVWTE